MFAVVGLGNPGTRYQDTRHNMGFWTLDLLGERFGLSSSGWKEKGGSEIAKLTIANEETLLVRPLQFMNRSGEASRAALSFFKIPAPNVIVVYDELDFDPGTVRLKRGGSSGGHNGVEDMIRHLESAEFVRVRIGIGHPRRLDPPSSMSTSDYVLSVARGDQAEQLRESCRRAADAVVEVIEKGFEGAQGKVNTRTRGEEQ